MNREVYLQKNEDYSEIAITENGNIEYYYKIKNDFLTNSIFVGKVNHVNKNIGIFVDIGTNRDGLLPYRPGINNGDYLICQVTKEAHDNKGCSLTEKISLTGRYCVITTIPGDIAFSRNIEDEDRIRLFSLPRCDKYGFIFRTACIYATNEEIDMERHKLITNLDYILAEGKNTLKVKPLYQETVDNIASCYAYSDDSISIGLDKIANQLQNIDKRRIQTEDGVEIVIDKTEAMHVIDVNIGKYNTQNKDIEQANLNANCIACKEIARQLRLRNIGGMTIVDFITLNTKESREELLNCIRNELSKDNVKSHVELVESVSLLVIVRKQRFSQFE